MTPLPATSSPAPGRSRDNMRAIGFMLAAHAAFVVNDTCVKLSTGAMSPPQIMAVRGMMTAVLLLALAQSRGALARPRDLLHPLLLWRTLADVGTTITYIAALASLPLANASAIFQALPLVITLGAALFLGETVGWRRWSAIAVGFLGVLVIVRPGAEGFTDASLLVLASVVFAAIRDLVTRRLPRELSSMSVSAMTAMAVSATGWALLPFWGWHGMTGPGVGILAIAAVALGFGYICIVEATRCGDMSVVSPFRYSILLYAIVIGIVLFGELPDAATLVGSAVVVASGAYTILRERAKGRRMPLAGPGQPH